MDPESCYGGGSIAGAVFGTLVAVGVLAAIFYWLYKKKFAKEPESNLIKCDEEMAYSSFAFDNPAFKGDLSKFITPLHPTWTQSGRRKEWTTKDDISVGTKAKSRTVLLKGLDFTGLGIELFGCMKEGIYIKKVMPQGPAAHTINPGDRIVSVTIDFNHIAQEDAMTILSYASPYNIQMELIPSDKDFPKTTSASQHVLKHPLYRSNSLVEVAIVKERSKPTSPASKSGSNSSAEFKSHQERKEKSNSLARQMKQLMTEKFQRHADVFPSSIKEKMLGKNLAKMDADNENNVNLERNEKPEMDFKPLKITTDFEEKLNFEERKPIESPQHSPEPQCTVINIDMTDHAQSIVEEAIKSAQEHINRTNKTHFDFSNSSSPEKESNPSTPHSEKKRISSDTESQMAHESDNEFTPDSNQIEINLKEPESDRRTHSLGDLTSHDDQESMLTSTGSFERAQSLELSQGQKKALVTVASIEHNHHHKTNEMRGADEWGDLEDVVIKESPEVTESREEEVKAEAVLLVADIVSSLEEAKVLFPPIERTPETNHENGTHHKEEKKVAFETRVETIENGTEESLQDYKTTYEIRETEPTPSILSNRFPFDSLERPKSDVLKKLASKIIIEKTPKPDDLTDETDNHQCESLDSSKFYSSNRNGINYIDISSDGPKSMDSTVYIQHSPVSYSIGIEHSSSKGSVTSEDIETFESIEKQIETSGNVEVSFDVGAPVGEKKNGPVTPPKPSPRNYVTEIKLKPVSPVKPSFDAPLESEKPPKVPEPKFVLNSEIKFTTAAYESPLSKPLYKNAKTTSSISQIRSNFEKPDLPAPVQIRRNSNSSSNKSSPSKIPVFNSLQRGLSSNNLSTNKDASTKPPSN